MPRTPPEIDAPTRKIARRTWRDLPAAPPTADEIAAPTPPPAPPGIEIEITAPQEPVETEIGPAPIVEIAAPPKKRAVSARTAIVVVSVLLLALGGAAAFAISSGGNGTAPASEATVQQVAADLGPSVVHIDTAIGVGSGVVVDESIVLTAAHVVAGVDEVTVKDQAGTEIPGRVVGRQVERDLAVVALDDDGELPAAGLASEPVEVGQDVVAVGSPFGFEQTVTRGIVSALDREVPTPFGTLTGLIQTDTAINPGNSGGPLADMSGDVVGIATAIASTSGSNSGVGFAVPVADAQAILDEVESNGGADAPTVPDASADSGSGFGPLPSLDDLLNDGLDGLQNEIDEYLPEEDIDALLEELESLYGDDINGLIDELFGEGFAEDYLGGELFPESESQSGSTPTPGESGGILDLSGLPSGHTAVSSRIATAQDGDVTIESQRVAIESPDGAVLLLAERSDDASDRFDDFDGDDVDLDGVDAKVAEDAASATYVWMIGDDVYVVLIVPGDTSLDDVSELANSVEVN